MAAGYLPVTVIAPIAPGHIFAIMALRVPAWEPGGCHLQYPLAWALFAVFLLTYVLPFVVNLLRLLRWEVRPVKITRLPETPALSPLQQAAADEITGLGFAQVAAYSYSDEYDSFTALLLKHPDQPAFANIYFHANPFTGYPVWFWSFAKDGSMLMTANRQPISLKLPGVVEADPYAETLALQWQAHQDRVKSADLAEVDGEEAYRRIVRANEDYVAWNISTGAFVETAGKIFLSFRTALRMSIEAMRRRRDLRKSYKGAVLGDAHRSAYYAELYTVFAAVRKRLKYRTDVAVVLLVLSFAISFAVFSWWMGWKVAAAVLLVLTVHELGHGVAMRFFGYRDMSMFFIPFAGAVVMGDIKTINVWQQTIVLLAGPVPGLVFGIWILMHPHDFPAGGFMHMLALNAAILNLFNLLPLSFLDGGKLVEIAFLARWPYALFAFSFISSLGMFWLIIKLQSYNMWVVGFVMALATRALWRIAGLRKDWAKQGEDKKDLKDLFHLAGQRLGSPSFNRQYYLVRSVYETPAVNPPRLWETAFALALFVVCWVSSITAAFAFFHKI